MGRKETERQKVRTKEVRDFTLVTGANGGHGGAPRSDTGHILSLASIVVIQHHSPTTSKLPVRNGAPALQVKKAYHVAKDHFDKFPSKYRETK